MEAARGGFRRMVGSGRPAAEEIEEDGRWRRRRFKEEDGRRKKKGVCGASPAPPRVEYRRSPDECERYVLQIM
jgi:hypothetical protein